MPFDFEQFETDEKSENEGRWFDYGDGSRFRIAAIGNPAFQKLCRKNAEQLRRLDKGLLSDSAARALLANIYARTILLGWEGVSHKGAPVAHSVAEAERRLGNRRFFDAIREIADDYRNFRAVETEEDAKHLGEESAGSSAGLG